jgi:hypothetical protein
MTITRQRRAGVVLVHGKLATRVLRRLEEIHGFKEGTSLKIEGLIYPTEPPGRDGNYGHRVLTTRYVDIGDARLSVGVTRTLESNREDTHFHNLECTVRVQYYCRLTLK